MSLPSRERGLKCQSVINERKTIVVAPFTGAWIEISGIAPWVGDTTVAPFTGAWIEISSSRAPDSWSLVAPFTGAWIEILYRWRSLSQT